MLNARKIFDDAHADFAEMAGTPESAKAFYKNHIEPAYAENRAKGAALEAAYGEAVAEYQRDAFIMGFEAAVQLILTSCCVELKQV